MQQLGIHAQWVKPWIATTVDSDFISTLHNILNERFNPPTPNRVWCTDITYIWTALDGFVYLTSIMICIQGKSSPGRSPDIWMFPA